MRSMTVFRKFSFIFFYTKNKSDVNSDSIYLLLSDDSIRITMLSNASVIADISGTFMSNVVLTHLQLLPQFDFIILRMIS